MIVMPANNTSWIVHYWAGLYGGLGHLYSPARGTPPFPHLPYGLDNGAYKAWKDNHVWDAAAFVAHVEYYAFNALRPSWVVVPDVVADARLTFSRWEHWAPRLLSDFHIPLALAVQDGMTVQQVRELSPAPEVIFVGGTTEWKWLTVKDWGACFPRVHVGRVNTEKQLEICSAAGVESCDGTGWFQGDPKQIAQLGNFLRTQAGCESADWVDEVVYHSRTVNSVRRCLAIDGHRAQPPRRRKRP